MSLRVHNYSYGLDDSEACTQFDPANGERAEPDENVISGENVQGDLEQ